MVTFSKVNLRDIKDEDDDEEEEPGEEIESAPPLDVGEEREIKSPFGCLKKKLLRRGQNLESPQFGDEVTIHCVGSLLDGTKFASTTDEDKPLTLKLGHGQMVTGLDHGIITMRKGEKALFTLPPEVGYGEEGTDGVPPNSIVQFEVELISWITVVDVCKGGGIIKKIMEKGDQIGPPSDLDEVCVNYKVTLVDGITVAETPEEGVEFYVKDGHFCPALAKAIKTMRRGEKVNLIVQPQYAFGDEGKEVGKFPPIPPNSVLNIVMELSAIKPIIDVTGDLKVKKKILKEGEGVLTANEGASVTIRYIAKLENGTVFERTGWDDGQPLEFITDEEQVIVGLDRAATTMKKGEYALVTISPEYGFGSSEAKRDLATVPSSSTVVYEVEMLDFTGEKSPWEMSNPEIIDTAARKKEEGNRLFKIGKYQRALKKYDKAAEYVNEDGIFTDDDQKLVKPLRLSCWLNGAACSLKLNDFQEAIKLCSKVLDVESCNVKALYRRAQAYMEFAELHLAELDIKKALEVEPANREVKLIQKNLKTLQAESNIRDARLYSAMFSRMTTDASNPAKRLKTAE